MIGAQQVVDLALAEAARLGKADETIVLVTDRADAVAAVGGQFDDHQRCFGAAATTTVISIVRRGDRGARRRR